MDHLAEFFKKYHDIFNHSLINFVKSVVPNNDIQMQEIFYYHLGLLENQKNQGKRMRPMLVLLCSEGAGADWRSAMPAAIAVELIHNFSLIHDDIEDNGMTRRGKDAVWVKWGLPIGLNAGDAMFAAAFHAMNGLAGSCDPQKYQQVQDLLSTTCLRLTYGQHLDLSFEQKEDVSITDYYQMIEGKTAALFACCAQLGAIIGEKCVEETEKYHEFGRYLGMTFQIYDDWLGIWGEPDLIGKSSSSDLIEGKKSLPVLLGLNSSEKFVQRWEKGPILLSETVEISDWLREDGVELLVKRELSQWNQKLISELDKLDCEQSVKLALRELADQMITRKK